MPGSAAILFRCLKDRRRFLGLDWFFIRRSQMNSVSSSHRAGRKPMLVASDHGSPLIWRIENPSFVTSSMYLFGVGVAERVNQLYTAVGVNAPTQAPPCAGTLSVPSAGRNLQSVS
ncbi:hypothetical protein T265_03471 [Opisthorchis viverrini]|uniref:Uncharacterized protein n=1 Tax=Opisthorchis viverrini TaxID=6198 RepID=A0A074ZRE2_OPIVI|nr:hypothetical protein T265_03471 [Opisthorchis viverrini]KER29988.1 hypothetical protein T265_03471 [Opisthorchis viverrini]